MSYNIDEHNQIVMFQLCKPFDKKGVMAFTEEYRKALVEIEEFLVPYLRLRAEKAAETPLTPEALEAQVQAGRARVKDTYKFVINVQAVDDFSKGAIRALAAFGEAACDMDGNASISFTNTTPWTRYQLGKADLPESRFRFLNPMPAEKPKKPKKSK
ncbi:MAG: hypothetical protein HQL53_07890 [Magnetococcales bacterium]|nr:hypothetical protein [Magnetococcales bacterium]